MPQSNKFLAESTCENIVKIDQHLAKMWTECNSLLFLAQTAYWELSLAIPTQFRYSMTFLNMF